MISKKYKKVSTILNYIEHLLILASTITGCISVSTFASLCGIRIGIKSSPIGSKIAAGIKNHKSKIKKKKKKHDKIALLVKSKLNSIEVFVLINYLPKEYDEIKEETKNLKT